MASALTSKARPLTAEIATPPAPKIKYAAPVLAPIPIAPNIAAPAEITAHLVTNVATKSVPQHTTHKNTAANAITPANQTSIAGKANVSNQSKIT